jgi:ribosomal protein L37E
MVTCKVMMVLPREKLSIHTRWYSFTSYRDPIVDILAASRCGRKFMVHERSRCIMCLTPRERLYTQYTYANAAKQPFPIL